jgi:NTE family protein
VFAPSRDIGAIAAEHVRQNLNHWRLGPLAKLLVRSAARSRVGRESDLASYLLFDGAFANQLIELGRQDAIARADEVREFFA